MKQVVLALERDAIDYDFRCRHKQQDDADYQKRQNRIDSAEQPVDVINIR